MSIELKFKTSNPIAFKSKEVKLLEKSYEELKEIMQEYALVENLSGEEMKQLEEAVMKAFFVKKAEFYMSHKLNKVAKRIDWAVCSAFHTNMWDTEAPHHTSLFYMKQSKHQLTNE